MFRKILNIGIKQSTSILEQSKIRMLNFLGILLVLIQPFALVLYTAQAQIGGLLFSFADGLSGAIVIFLQHRHQYQVARVSILIYIPFSLLFQITTFPAPEMQFFWLCALLGVFFLFDAPIVKKVFFAYIGSTAIAAYMYLHYVSLSPFSMENFVNTAVNLSVIVILVLISSYQILSFFVKNTQYFQHLAEEKNQEMLKQNEEIQQQADQLNKVNKMKDRLFSIIAHDIRNPVVALRNTIDILSPDVLNTNELEFIKAELLKQFDGLDFTLNNLLIWTKSQIKGEVLQKENIEMEVIMEQILKFFSNTLNTKGLYLHNHIPAGTKVYADPNHLRFILRNVIFNAIKFSFLGGSITISAKEDAHDVTIWVRDKGIGISKAKQKELFDTYTNYSTEGTQGEKGTGLGLIICKEFVEKNGGKIGVESEVGEGSSFWFTLPKSQ